jgi:8-amino-7-oxononanoate synthase
VSGERATKRSDPLANAAEQVRQLREQNLSRNTSTLTPLSGCAVRLGDKILINFSSNDYLDLASHPLVIASATEALAQYGASARASRLVAGTFPIHEELEAELAAFKGTESALVFSSGYLGSMGVIQALSRRADGSAVPIFFDRLAHASIVDGALSSGRSWRTFEHNDRDALERLLGHIPQSLSPRAIVVTEGVFSMDGDVAPLPDLFELCETHDALLVVDDAHGTGTMGPQGCGTISHFGLSDSRIVQLGTLSKALGSQGGFVAGARVLIELLINRARTFIFETALAPSCAAAALQALRIVRDESERVAQLQANARLLREKLGIAPSCTPIIPVILGSESAALHASSLVQAQGFLVPAIRPPTVPRGTSRIRITVSCSHTIQQIEKLATAIRTSQATQCSPKSP